MHRFLFIITLRSIFADDTSYVFPDDDTQYCPSASENQRDWCYTSKDGICVTTEEECDALDGNYFTSGCGSSCNCCGGIGTKVPTVSPAPTASSTTEPTVTTTNEPTFTATITKAPSLSPTIIAPDWAFETTCQNIATDHEINWCWTHHEGVCTSSESECVDLYQGTTSEAGCSYPTGSGCFCCHAATEDSPEPTSLPTTETPSLSPTILAPDWAFETTCSNVASDHEIHWCWTHHEGVCTSSESECVDLYGGTTSEAGCSYPTGSGCFCCHAANGPPEPTFEPTTQIPSLSPTILAPDWAFETTCSNIASDHEIHWCWTHHEGVCTSSEEECTEIYSGTTSEAGCSYPTGSGCFCCHSAFEFEPTSAPTVLAQGDKKKKKSGLGLGILILIIVIFCICICINCCLLFFFCCYKKEDEEEEEVENKILIDAYMQTDAIKEDPPPPKSRVFEEVTTAPEEPATYFEKEAEASAYEEDHAPTYKSYDPNAFGDFDDELSAPIPMPVITQTYARKNDRIQAVDDVDDQPPPNQNAPWVFCDDGSGRADQRRY